MKIPLCLICAFLFFADPLMAAESVEQRAHEAEAFFELKDYSKALLIYDALHKENLNGPQSVVIAFNRARTLLEMERWSEASAAFEEIASNVNTHPALAQKSYLNIAIAKLRNAQKMSLELHSEDKEPKEAISQSTAALNLIQEGFLALNKAKKAEEDLSVIEGKEFKEHSKDTLDVYETLKMQQGWLKIQIAEIRLRSSTDLENIKNILDRVALSKTRVELIGNQKTAKKQAELYLKEEAMQMKSARPFWEEQRRRMKNQPNEALDETFVKLFAEAEKSYLSSEELLKEGRLWKGREQLASAYYQLNALKRLEEHDDPLRPLLEETVAIRKQINQTPPTDPIYSSLITDDRSLHALAVQVIPQLPKEKVLEQELFDELKKNLLASSQEKPGDVQGSVERLLFYDQITTAEGETLLDLYLFSQQADTQSQEKQAGFFSKLLPLQKKFTVRESLQVSEDDKKKINTSLEIIGDILAEKQAVSHDPAKWKEISSKLEDIITVWDPVKMVQGKLINLQAHYKKILDHLPLKTDDLSSLSLEAEKLKEYAEKAKVKSSETNALIQFRQNLEQAMGRTNQAETALKADKPLSSNLFLTDAEVWLKRSLPLFDEDKKNTPEQILEESLAEQETAFDANKLLHVIEKEEGISEDLFKIIPKGQEIVIKNIDPLPKIIPEEQKKQSPWKEAIPLIEKGKTAAADAQGYLHLSKPELSKAFSKQGEAIRFWKEALEKLKSPQQDQNQENSGNSSQQQDQQDQQDQQENLEQKQEKLAPQKVFELLQTMEREDERDREKNDLPPKQGLRPW